jgi:hypothetical protein
MSTGSIIYISGLKLGFHLHKNNNVRINTFARFIFYWQDRQRSVDKQDSFPHAWQNIPRVFKSHTHRFVTFSCASKHSSTCLCRWIYQDRLFGRDRHDSKPRIKTVFQQWINVKNANVFPFYIFWYLRLMLATKQQTETCTIFYTYNVFVYCVIYLFILPKH